MKIKPLAFFENDIIKRVVNKKEVFRKKEEKEVY